MASILIKDTTREERARIVDEAIGNIEGLCDGCSPGLLKMYDDYIDGKKELREVNREKDGTAVPVFRDGNFVF